MTPAVRFRFSHRRPLLTLLLALLSLGAQAQATWTGATSTDWATASNWSTGAVPTATDDVVIPFGPTNQPTLSTPGAVAKSVQVSGRLTITSTGTLTINGSGTLNAGFYNAGTVENAGTITLGNTASVGEYGIYNTRTFTNQAGGTIRVDSSSQAGIRLFSGTFTNAGSIILGANASVGQYGIRNFGTFTNQAGGSIRVDRSSQYGIVSEGTFTNGGSIILGANAPVGQYGIMNRRSFTNQASGSIQIDNANGGLGNEILGISSFTNQGRITIGAIAPVGQLGIVNIGPFENSGCSALLHIVADARIENDVLPGIPFNNSGTIIINASGTSSISSNSGLVQNLGSGTFNIGTNTGTLTSTPGAIWKGCTSTDWATATNWSTGAVPTATDDVTIPSGPANQPTLSSAGAVAKSVDVQSGAKLTITSGGTLTINGSGSNNAGFNNAGTVENAGTITLGNTASVGEYGIHNFWGTMTNQAGGTIRVDRSSLSGIFSQGPFTNAGSIIVGANASVGQRGILNVSTFTNQAGGSIQIDNCTAWGLFNDIAGMATFTNQGRITLGANAPVGGAAVLNRAHFENSGCSALLHIVSDAVIDNDDGTFTNTGTIIENASGTSSITSNSGLVQNLGSGTFNIGTNTGTLTSTAGAIWKGCTSTDWATASNWSTGAVPTATDDVTIPSGPANQPTLSSAGAVAKTVLVEGEAKLTIASTGSLTLNGSRMIWRDESACLRYFGTVDNAGTLIIGNTASVGTYGIYASGTFTNQSGGSIHIDRSTGAGVYISGLFTNAGSLHIGANAPVGARGLLNQGTFTNHSGGQLTIDRASFMGVWNFAARITNAGSITLGAKAYVGSSAAIFNSGSSTFENSGCTALLNIVADAIIDDRGTFTNSGTIFENATGTSGIRSNSGIIVNQNGGTFAVGSDSNQPLAVVITNATQCAPPNGSIQLTGLKANQPYTLRYTLNGGTPILLSPDSTSTASGTLTIPGLGAGTYALSLSGSCVPLPIQLEASLTGPAPGIQGKPTLTGVPACAGQPLTVTFRADCGGTFTAQLSDASGSFDNPVSLGAVTSGGTVLLPVGTPTGSGYRLRVVSQNPALTSEPTDAFRVTALSVALFPATPGRICLGDALPVTFSTTGNCPYPQGNVFTVQLSNSTGSFANPTVLGPAPVGTTSFVLPQNLPAGTGYRVRILTGNPAQTSSASAPFELRYPGVASLTPGVGGVPSGGICRGQAVTLSFSLPGGSCAFPGGNAFTAQLSSATGGFANPVNLGPVQAGVTTSLTIPANSAAGTGYRIRVVSSAPASMSLSSSPFRVNAVGCNSRLSAEEPDLVVAPNPVRGSEIRLRVAGMDNPAFTLTSSAGRNVMISVNTDGSGAFVLVPRQALAPGVYAVGATEGTVRLTRRVLVAD